MADAGETGADTISFERVYDAPVEDVWALWTTRDGLAEWFAPEGMHVEVSALELRVGGAFEHVMTAVGPNRSPTWPISTGRRRCGSAPDSSRWCATGGCASASTSTSSRALNPIPTTWWSSFMPMPGAFGWS